MIAAMLTTVACHPGSVVSTDPPLQAGGTIAGIVRTTEGSTRLTTRKVTVTNVKTGATYETTTGANGGYTIKVPQEGTYRVNVETRDGETIAKRPDEIRLNNGDLDPGRDFEITVKPKS